MLYNKTSLLNAAQQEWEIKNEGLTRERQFELTEQLKRLTTLIPYKQALQIWEYQQLSKRKIVNLMNVWSRSTPEYYNAGRTHYHRVW